MTHAEPDTGRAERTLTRMLNDGRETSRNGNFGRWINLVYSDLRRLSKGGLYRQFDEPIESLTESPTSIANAALMKLLGQRKRWENREHFFAVATRLIGYIVGDYRDKRLAIMRGGGNRGTDVDGAPELAEENDSTAFFDAIQALHDIDARAAEVVTLHIFAKNTLPAVAELVGMSLAAVERDWHFAKVWLKGFLRSHRGS